ncbi:hypothetical protein IFM89_023008 [Coptis chinensis]|uniref:PROP1-like PPR domain-containing protein n=1 Tax=Coptis chinensis TaxID=261450 RepID=A0A835IFB3_9MAGN|nr:hypothetical protein IFM89_023008 [Coptis chinensis]
MVSTCMITKKERRELKIPDTDISCRQDIFQILTVPDTVVKYGYCSDVYVQTSLLDFYSKLDDMETAEKVFNDMPEKNVISWNSILFGFLKAGELCKARGIFDKIPIKDVVSWNSMILGYAKAGDFERANHLFAQMPDRNSASWNSMISGLKEALQLFNEMRKHNVNVQPDEMTFACAISACSQLGDLEFGLWIETYRSKIGVELDDHLATALVDLYAKCGNIEKAYELFHGLKKKDVVAYSALIFGCGINGKAFEAIRLFREMTTAQIRPNSITYSGILTAYNHAGLVEEG